MIDLRIAGFCLFVLVFPKAGLLTGAAVPLQLSVVLGVGASAIGWQRALGTPSRLPSQLGILLLVTASIAWLIGITRAVNAPGAISQREISRLLFNIIAIAGLGTYFWALRRGQRLARLVSGVRWSYYALLAYAVAQIVLGPEAVAVRNLTAQYDTVFDEVLRRSNVVQRLDGEAVKLFGTYQNGNLFALALILIGPIAMYSERKRWVQVAAHVVLHVAIVFSASTTGYVALIIWDALLAAILIRHRDFLPAAILGFLAGLPFLILGPCSSGTCTPVDLIDAKLFSRDLTSNVRWDKTAEWLERALSDPARLLGGEMHDGTVRVVFESVPFSLAQTFGIFVPILFYWFVLSALRPMHFQPYKIGVIAYLVAGVGSGGIWLTPIPFLLGIAIGLCASLDREGSWAARPFSGAALRSEP